MKTGTKKFLYTIFAVILALGLGIGAILLSMLNVQASTEMMPGIEQILDEKSEKTPFRILELVNNSADAEIGYYISGQEPYLSQYKYTPTNVDGTKGGDTDFFFCRRRAFCPSDKRTASGVCRGKERYGKKSPHPRLCICLERR